MMAQQLQLFQMKPADTPVDSEENISVNPPVSDRDLRVKKTKSVPDTVKTVHQETQTPFQLIPEILKEADFYSQVPLNLDQQVTLKCPNLTENEQTDIEVNLSKFLWNQLTEGPQSLTFSLRC